MNTLFASKEYMLAYLKVQQRPTIGTEIHHFSGRTRSRPDFLCIGAKDIEEILPEIGLTFFISRRFIGFDKTNFSFSLHTSTIENQTCRNFVDRELLPKVIKRVFALIICFRPFISGLPFSHSRSRTHMYSYFK